MESLVIILLAALLVAGSAKRDEPRPVMKAAKATEAPWSVVYHDGSGNGFRFWKEADKGKEVKGSKGSKSESARFKYSPIRPENSSTGMYDCGERKHGRLDDERDRD